MALNWLTEGMKVASWVMGVFATLFFTTTTTLAAVSLSLPGCQEKCGNLTIPYPFGIGSNCSANSSFAVTCQNSSTNIPPKLFFSSINLEVVNISLYGSVIVNHPVSPMNCSVGLRTESLPISLKGTPFTISARYNSLLVMGCKNLVWLRANETTVGGCMPICDANSTDTSCSGVNCCQSSIPRPLQELQFSYESIHARNSSPCGYIFPVDKKWLRSEDHKRYKGLLTHLSNPFDPEFRFAPLVLEWEFGNVTKSSYIICTHPLKENALDNILLDFCWKYYAQQMAYHDYSPRCRSVLNNNKYDINSLFYYGLYDYVSSRGYCSCILGSEGNPYIFGGCSREINGFGCPTTCVNTSGSCHCGYQNKSWFTYYYDDNDRGRAIIKKVAIVIGSVVGVMILLLAAWKSGKAITMIIMIIKASRKYMFFKRNGGLLLEQRLAALQNGLDHKTKLFNSNELAKATNNYNENRVLGRGGEGVVYKGMLEDGTIVAVKKSERVSQGDVESFINEVVIVSQINHRNVVKLLGCCLESEVPRVVYEFIPNGTLFHHIHDPHEDFPLFWEMRVRIAKEVAAALAYLHSAASVPIYHRDIKSTNILLDEKYRAKISDFGTSRSVLIDQTHVTTRVVGTFGYLDPEYFQSSKFTEKSDVYSFGVVLVELLTGEKAISVARVEEERGLVMYFLHSMGVDQLFDIVDARVVKEGTREDIEAMAEIARKCLHLNGKSRPTMKEVSREIQVEKGESQNQIESSGRSSVEDDDDSDDFSSISEATLCRDENE